MTEENAADYLKRTAEEFARMHRVRLECGICGLRALVYEDKPSVFGTIEEAMAERPRGGFDEPPLEMPKPPFRSIGHAGLADTLRFHRAERTKAAPATYYV